MKRTAPRPLNASFVIDSSDDAYCTVTVLTLESLKAVFAMSSQIGVMMMQSPSIVVSLYSCWPYFFSSRIMHASAHSSSKHTKPMAL